MPTTFPAPKPNVINLVADHKKLTDEPLLLAIYYAPTRNPESIFLFEIFDGFGANQVDEDRTLFEVNYAGKSNFPLEPGQELHLVVTNIPEFTRALAEDWPHIRELREAIARGDFEVLYAHPTKAVALRSGLGA